MVIEGAVVQNADAFLRWPKIFYALFLARPFPIYHIPPTDCSYETDTSFFLEPAVPSSRFLN